MTHLQRITLMADWWPKACRAQGWKTSDRVKRLEVLSAAVGRPLASASELNSTTDVDKVKAHLGMLANNVAATIETDRPYLGRARRLRVTIGEQLKCLGVYLPVQSPESKVQGRTPAEAYLAQIIRDKFKHGSRVEPLTIEDLSAEPRHFTDRAGKLRELPSQLEQVVMTLARAIQAKRKAAKDSLHDMKLKAGVRCTCRLCSHRGVKVVVLAPPVRELEPAIKGEVPW